MTERQIENLKKLLCDAQAKQNSPELDEKILAASIARATQTEPLLSFMRFRSVGLAALSITLTIGAFLIMSRMVSVSENPEQFLVKTDALIPSTADNTEKSVEPVTDRVAATGPTQSPTYQRPAAGTRDEILAAFELPSAEKLLDSMEFSMARDRSFATSALTEALADIKLMIRGGELDDARNRYHRLRHLCTVCTLPSTLEALALSSNTLPART